MAFGLSEHIMNQLVDLFDKNDQVEAAVLFGSRAKGNYREGSDIDIALKGNKLTFVKYLKQNRTRITLMQRIFTDKKTETKKY